MISHGQNPKIKINPTATPTNTAFMIHTDAFSLGFASRNGIRCRTKKIASGPITNSTTGLRANR